jgi:polyisoprenyl-teichoic acid--peptidoglycan teichoic acid transferase
MSNYPPYADEPTDRLPPRSPSREDQQSELIIGAFQSSPKQLHRPYQSPYAEQPTVYAQRQPEPVGPTMAAPVQPPPVGASSAPGYPPPRPVGGRYGKPRRGCLLVCLVILLLLCVLGSFTVYTAQRVLAFGSAISTQSPLSTQTGYMGTSDRVNFLVMGYGGGNHDGANLTDSMVVLSLLPQSHHTTLISVPRDLWVQYPPNSGQYTKINAVYEFASNNGEKPVDGGSAVVQKVSLVTGLDVKYWMTINFDGFREFINSIGGIDVYVPDSFNACYPKNDDAAIDPGWIKVQFDKGMQHMNGDRAITYARAREPLEVCGQGTSENLAELTDFGRSARQQIIIKAALAKVKQVSTWPGLFGAMDALKKALYTNLSLADLTQFALKMDLNNAHHVGLSNDNVLEDSIGPNGETILLPKNGNWQGIQDYVKQNLYT